jgi:hypothetical protein
MECNYLENTQKELVKEITLLNTKLYEYNLTIQEQKKEITLLNTKLYEYNLTIQEQKKKIYQLQKELDEEKICHYLTKKLCIFPTKLKN